MATLEIDGATLGYAEVGTAGPAVLMMHGTTMRRNAFDAVCAAMPPDDAYRYVLMDLPGSGESSLPALPLTVDHLAAQAHALMQHLGHERYHVVGFSIGAEVGAALAANEPQATRSLTLIAGWIRADARMIATFELWRHLILRDPMLFVRYGLVDGFTAAFHEQMAPMLEAVIAASEGVVAPGSTAQIDLDIALDITSAVARISAPTMIIGGDEDRWVDVAHSHALGRAITGSRVEVVPAGHMMIIEQPAAIAALLHHHLAAN